MTRYVTQNVTVPTADGGTRELVSGEKVPDDVPQGTIESMERLGQCTKAEETKQTAHAKRTKAKE